MSAINGQVSNFQPYHGKTKLLFDDDACSVLDALLFIIIVLYNNRQRKPTERSRDTANIIGYMTQDEDNTRETQHRKLRRSGIWTPTKTPGLG